MTPASNLAATANYQEVDVGDKTLTDEDIKTTWTRGGSGAGVLEADPDSTDPDSTDSDGTDGDSTDTTDGDSGSGTDSDSQDS